MDQKLFDQQVQRQLDIVNKILAATIQDRETAREAAAAVNTLSARVDARLTSLAAEVRGSAEETATQAAHLLEKHFTAANIAAEDARLCFERARQALGWKVFAILVAAFLAVVVMVYLLIPSLDEIKARREEITSLERNVEALERRGARFQVEDCPAYKGKKTVLCIRVDDSNDGWRGKHGEVYRQPWQP